MRYRWLLLSLLIIAFAWLVLTRQAAIAAFFNTVAQEQWQWLLLALLLQVAFYVLYAALYQAAFSAVEVEAHVLALLPVMLSSVFVNTVAPSLGASGAALFVEDAVRRGQSSVRTAAGTLIVPIADVTAFTAILLIGLGYLAYRNDLRSYELASAAVLMLLNLTLTGMLFLGLRRAGLLRRLLGWFQSLVDAVWQRLRHHTLLPAGWAERTALEFAQAARAMASHRDYLYRCLALAAAANLANLASIYVLFLSFHQAVRLGVLVAGFAMGVVLSLISITPQGVGVVEGAMGITYTSLGIPAATSAAVVLIYRGLNVALPVLVGFLLLRRSRFFRGKG